MNKRERERERVKGLREETLSVFKASMGRIEELAIEIDEMASDL